MIKELIEAILAGQGYIEKFNDIWNQKLSSIFEEMKSNMATNMFSDADVHKGNVEGLEALSKKANGMNESQEAIEETEEALDEISSAAVQNYAKANARQQAGAKQHIASNSPFKKQAEELLAKRKKGMASVVKRSDSMTMESEETLDESTGIKKAIDMYKFHMDKAASLSGDAKEAHLQAAKVYKRVADSKEGVHKGNVEGLEALSKKANGMK